jgi:hypothetical protein
MPEPTENKSANREVTTWRARPFFIGIIAFYSFMAALLIVVGGLTVSWTHQTWPPRGPVEGPAARSGWNTTSPQLEIRPVQDLQAVRKSAYAKLHTIQWTDDSRSFAAIPIERAMTLLTEAQANHQLNTLLPEPKAATPLELQNQKSTEAGPHPNGP